MDLLAETTKMTIKEDLDCNVYVEHPQSGVMIKVTANKYGNLLVDAVNCGTEPYRSGFKTLHNH